MKSAPQRTPAETSAQTDRHLSRIVHVLADHAMMVVSGTKIAEEIGISRSEVWRLIQQLRASGVQIAGHPATGYRLEAVPDLLLPDAIDPLIKGTLFHGKLRHYFRAGSTNALAMQAGQAGEPEGRVFFAEEQTAGRGRGGHDWHSARSTGVYVSILLRPAMAPADVLTLSLLAGLATAAAIAETTQLVADLKWPNDLLLSRTVYTPEGGCQREERKVCGILTELNAEVTRVRFVVVGIGINVNQAEFPPELAEIATSLRLESGQEWSRVKLAAALLQSFDREYRRFGEPGSREILIRRFEEDSSFARGRQVRIEEEGGYTGVTEGLDARGFLQLRGADGILRTVLSGTVRGI